jgi:hypothetical protein
MSSFGIREILAQRKENRVKAGNVVYLDGSHVSTVQRREFDRRIAQEIRIQCESQFRVEQIRADMRALGLVP